MDFSNCEIDAKLLEQFSSLGTEDKEDLVEAFKLVVGREVTSECSKFFLELANWNLQKGIGAYFDYSFEAAPHTVTNGRQTGIVAIEQGIPQLGPNTPVYDARVYHSPNSDFKPNPSLIWCVQNSGSSVWPKESYIVSEVDSCVAQLITDKNSAAVWIPLRPETRIPLPELQPGDFTHLVVDFQPPSDEISMHAIAANVPVIGAMRLCLPDGSRFGEILYCSALPNPLTRTLVFKTGVPEISNAELLMTGDQANEPQPMEDL